MKKFIGMALVTTLMLASQSANAGGIFSFIYAEPAPVYVQQPVAYYPATRVVYSQPYYPVRYVAPRQCNPHHWNHHQRGWERNGHWDNGRWNGRGHY